MAILQTDSAQIQYGDETFDSVGTFPCLEADTPHWKVYLYKIGERGQKVFEFPDCSYSVPQAEAVTQLMLNRFQQGVSTGRLEVKTKLRDLLDTTLV